MKIKKTAGVQPGPKPSAEPSGHGCAVVTFPASRFQRYPGNRTPTEEAVADMRESILSVGILQPLMGRFLLDKILIEIIGGETRWLAACGIDPEHPIPVIIHECSDKDAAKIHALDNSQRDNLNPIEQGKVIKNLRDHLWKDEHIAKFLRLSRAVLFERLNLLKLPLKGQDAVIAGTMPMKAALVIASLPEEKREEAVTAILEPNYSLRALQQREALELIDRDFVQPAAREKEWNERRNVILENHQGAKWLAYTDAKNLSAWNSSYVATDTCPTYELLSPAAKLQELIVPTWGELAAKHGTEIVIGCGPNGEAITYVLEAPLIAAEKAACDHNPVACIFIHEAGRHADRLAVKQRKMKDDLERVTALQERRQLQQLVLRPDGIKPPVMKKLMESVYLYVLECSVSLEDLGELFEIPQDAATGEVEKATLKYCRKKTLEMGEAVWRLQLAAGLGFKETQLKITSALFNVGAIKGEEFPVSFRNHTNSKDKSESPEK